MKSSLLRIHFLSRVLLVWRWLPGVLHRHKESDGEPSFLGVNHTIDLPYERRMPCDVWTGAGHEDETFLSDCLAAVNP